jgi:hypothetical protein
LADPVGSGILMVDSGMAGEFGGTVSLSILHHSPNHPAAFGHSNFDESPSFISMDRLRSGSPSAASMQI